LNYSQLRDPNTEYTMRDLSAETMGLSRSQVDRDVESTDVQTVIVDGNYPWTLVRVYTDAGAVGNGGALVEVDYAGLCESDAGIYEFESAFERMNLPTVIGHEYAGRIVETGDGRRRHGLFGQ
jgi:threonine dehydrogenase-like Zn-dependent dehydrogenase